MLYDIAIIGSGPQGLYAAYKLKNMYNIICLEQGEFIANNIKNYPNIIWHHSMGPLKLPEGNEIDDDKYENTNFISNYYNDYK